MRLTMFYNSEGQGLEQKELFELLENTDLEHMIIPTDGPHTIHVKSKETSYARYGPKAIKEELINLKESQYNH